MELELTRKQLRRLLDLVYIGNWILNSTRGEDRFKDYDEVESLLFARAALEGMPSLAETYQGEVIPSRAFAEGGIHEAIMECSLRSWRRIWPAGIWTTCPSTRAITTSWPSASTPTSTSSRPTAPTTSPWTADRRKHGLEREAGRDSNPCPLFSRPGRIRAGLSRDPGGEGG